MTVRASTTDLVHQLFVRTADENYITCRWCAANGLRVDFFWLALHAVEKYLKAVLLLNGKSAKEQSHDIVGLYAEVKAIAGALLPGNLAKPPNLGLPFWRDRTAEQFIQHLQNNGDAPNRYLIYGYQTHIENVFMLDQIIFAVRRLVCRLDENRFNAPGVPALTNREFLAKYPKRGARLSLPFDKLIDGRNADPKRHTLLNFNFPFAPDDYPHESAHMSAGSENPVILRRIIEPLQSSNEAWALDGLKVAAWFAANIKVPSSVNKEIMQSVLDARKRFAWF